jgi:hypothetical protein
MTSLTIPNLPLGTTYYFAIRAVSTADEESAFSQEVAVTIGDPTTSTAPLMLNQQNTSTPPQTNPLQGQDNLPGETGIPTFLIILIITSALIGTVLASRRQLTATLSHPPRE